MSGYIGVEPVTQVTKVRTFGTLVEASTTIPVAGGFSPGNIEVYINGDYVLPTDYNESDGLTIVFGITLTAGTDYVVIEARQFLVADTWSKAEADTRYAEITGGADANFAVMPQVGGDPVVESGSNADGQWTRFAEGTQVCIGVLPNISMVSNTGGAASGSFPIAFISVPAKSTAGTPTASGDFYGAIYYDNGNSLVTINPVFRNGVTAQTVAEIRFIAIGRWK